VDYQDKVLGALAGDMGEFYLAGGTALARYYFQHRESYDLDFFTQNFSRTAVFAVTDKIKKKLGFEINLVEDIDKVGMLKVMIFYIKDKNEDVLKIDFVEDSLKLISDLRNVDGIPVMSKEDIYKRKIYAAAGYQEAFDILGRRIIRGGRQSPKDFCDLYFLSHTFIPLSDFVAKYSEEIAKEGIVKWFRSYDRLEMKMGLFDLNMKKTIDYREMERHFKEQVDILIAREIDFI